MHKVFIFDIPRSDEEQARRRTIVFVPFKGVAVDYMVRELQSYFSSRITPDQVILMGPLGCKQMLEGFLRSNVIEQALPTLARLAGPEALTGFYLNITGQMVPFNPEQQLDGSILSRRFWDHVRKQGMIKIFEERRGMVDPAGAYHFVKPSKAHSDRFIRTANVLLYSEEIAFIAFWVLHYLTDATRTIYTDTAAILSVAYASIAMRLEADPNFRVPVVASFGSYRGIEENFAFDKNALILISASTSGDLEDTIISRKIEANAIITLYYLARAAGSRKILCDLTRRGRSRQGYKPIENHPPDNCPLCDNPEVRAIDLIGDQFIPEEPKVKLELLSPGLLPPWFGDFASNFLGTGVIHCHYRNPDLMLYPREIYCDFASVFEWHPTEATAQFWRPFLQNLDRLLMQIVPASLRQIVYLDDRSSKSLAERIRQLYMNHGKNKLHLVSVSELDKQSDTQEAWSGATMVVAGTIVTGRRLISASQLLRELQNNAPIQYLVAVSRTRDAEWLKQVKRTLQYGNNSPEDYDFHVLSEIYIPQDLASEPSSWAQEYEFIQGQLLPMARDKGASISVQNTLVERLETLSTQSDRGGLTNNLFWESSVNNRPMKLTEGFSLWPFKSGQQYNEASQADVYFSVLANLHRQRESRGRDQQKSAFEPNRVLLSPICFDRYNDGVIQASLLRIAYNSELNYERTQWSAMMMEVLMEVFQDSRRGEARTEFLLAIAMRKLRLSPEHLTWCLQALEPSRQHPNEVERLLVDWIKENVLAPRRKNTTKRLKQIDEPSN